MTKTTINPEACLAQLLVYGQTSEPTSTNLAERAMEHIPSLCQELHAVCEALTQDPMLIVTIVTKSNNTECRATHAFSNK